MGVREWRCDNQILYAVAVDVPGPHTPSVLVACSLPREDASRVRYVQVPFQWPEEHENTSHDVRNQRREPGSTHRQVGQSVAIQVRNGGADSQMVHPGRSVDDDGRLAHL